MLDSHQHKGLNYNTRTRFQTLVSVCVCVCSRSQTLAAQLGTVRRLLSLPPSVYTSSLRFGSPRFYRRIVSLCLSTHSVYGFRATLYPSLSRLSVSRSAERLASASHRGLTRQTNQHAPGGVTIADDRNVVKTAFFNRDQNATKTALTETTIWLNRQNTTTSMNCGRENHHTGSCERSHSAREEETW